MLYVLKCKTGLYGIYMHTCVAVMGAIQLNLVIMKWHWIWKYFHFSKHTDVRGKQCQSCDHVCVIGMQVGCLRWACKRSPQILMVWCYLAASMQGTEIIYVHTCCTTANMQLCYQFLYLVYRIKLLLRDIMASQLFGHWRCCTWIPSLLLWLPF